MTELEALYARKNWLETTLFTEPISHDQAVAYLDELQAIENQIAALTIDQAMSDQAESLMLSRYGCAL